MFASKLEFHEIVFTPLSTLEASAYIANVLLAERGGTVVTPNLHTFSEIRKGNITPDFINKHDLILCDSRVIQFLINLENRSRRIPRATGSDLVFDLMEMANINELRVAILGGSELDNSEAEKKIFCDYSKIRVVFRSSLQINFPDDTKNIHLLGQELREMEPNLVTLSFGFPKQEQVCDILSKYLPNTWFINIGAGLSYFAGTQIRSPRILQFFSLEWLWRLVLEPRRLFKRYILEDLPTLIRLIFSNE